jgi:monothiol glutaredoxin
MTDDQKTLVKNMINSDRVFLMLKGTPEMPRCAFSARVVQILNGMGASDGSFNIFDDYNIVNMIKDIKRAI